MNRLDLAASKIYFSTNNMAANPSFLSEENYVIITEQYKGMCFNLNSIAVPESSSLYPSFTESSQSSQFKNVRMSCRKHNCSARSFSAVYVSLTDCVYQNTCQKGYFNITVCVCVCVCVYPSVKALSETRLSLSLSLCVCVCVCVHLRASMCAAECRKRSVSPETRANDKLSLYGGYTY